MYYVGMQRYTIEGRAQERGMDEGADEKMQQHGAEREHMIVWGNRLNLRRHGGGGRSQKVRTHLVHRPSSSLPLSSTSEDTSISTCTTSTC